MKKRYDGFYFSGWWARPDLNRGPSDYESPALTAELRARHAKNKNGCVENADLTIGCRAPEAQFNGHRNFTVHEVIGCQYCCSLRSIRRLFCAGKNCRQANSCLAGNNRKPILLVLVLAFPFIFEDEDENENENKKARFRPDRNSAFTQAGRLNAAQLRLADRTRFRLVFEYFSASANAGCTIFSPSAWQVKDVSTSFAVFYPLFTRKQNGFRKRFSPCDKI